MIKVSGEDAIRELRKATAGKPEDYVYESPHHYVMCLNWHVEDDAPGCIVGHALHSLGIDMRDYPEGTIRGVARRLHEDGVAEIDDVAVTTFVAAQSAQDQKIPWYESVEVAAAVARSLGIEDNQDDE